MVDKIKKSKKTKEQAMEQGAKMGLSGTHKMPDGSFMPGKTHKEYMTAVFKKNKKPKKK